MTVPRGSINLGLQGSSTVLRLRYELAASFGLLWVRNCRGFCEQSGWNHAFPLWKLPDAPSWDFLSWKPWSPVTRFGLQA